MMPPESRMVQVEGGALERYVGAARRYLADSRAANTVRAYRSDWNDFSGFCNAHGLANLPALPQTVALYLTHLTDGRGLKARTLERRLAAIAQVHEAAGHPSPGQDAIVRNVMKGIRRVHGTAQASKAALIPVTLRQLLSGHPTTVRDYRDRALLLVGFAGAFRRSELVALKVEDLEFTTEGLIVHLRRSKTDQGGEGNIIGIPFGKDTGTCPVRAVQDWLGESGIREGYLFRPVDRWTGVAERPLESHRVATIVKEYAKTAGLDPAMFSAHSLRSGLATAAAAAGVSERAIMDQTRHRSVKTVRRYIQRGSVFRENAAAAVGL